MSPTSTTAIEDYNLMAPSSPEYTDHFSSDSSDSQNNSPASCPAGTASASSTTPSSSSFHRVDPATSNLSHKLFVNGVTFLTAQANSGRNTSKAYNLKEKEFRQFCDTQINKPPRTRYTVTPDKAQKFIFYQSFREKKKRDRKKANEDDSDFDLNEYWRLIQSFKTDKNGKLIMDLNNIEPKDGVGFSVICTHQAVLIRLLGKQKDLNANQYSRSDILSPLFQSITKYVKE